MVGATKRGKMIFGEAFAGIGGISLGLQRAGMTGAWQIEIDWFCQKVLEKNFPDTQKFYDVRDCGKHNLSEVDLIAGGFPCQPHSVAGKRKGKKDERDMWPDLYRLVCELRPKWLLAENVPGLLSTDHGRFFGGILRDLDKIGYDAEWAVLSAAQFGASHLRERVYLVAYPSSDRLQRRAIFGSWDKIWQKRQKQLSRLVQASMGVERPKPELYRDTYGVSRKLDRDRIEALGNAVYVPVIEWIGRLIMEAETDD